jgi:hypothetical protein
MLVRVSRVRAGEELLAHTTVLRVGNELHHGLKPLIGVNLVAGITGSGKTLLAEALWLGIAHTLSGLLRDERFRDALVAAAEAYGIRPIDMKFKACLNDVEVPGLRNKTCIEVDVRGGVESWTAVPDDVMGNEKLRRSLVYALMHTISVPDKVKWRAAHALQELHRVGLLELAPENGLQELCLATAALAPPAAYEREGNTYVPCYVRMLGLERLLHAAVSHGEMSYALFEAAYETAYRISKLAREELGVSMIPIVYIDDAFEGLDARRMRSLLSRDYGDASIYAATHRIEAGAYSARNFLLTYGTRASELVEQPSNFRFALVDTALVESRKEIYKDVSSKLLLDE